MANDFPKVCSAIEKVLDDKRGLGVVSTPPIVGRYLPEVIKFYIQVPALRKLSSVQIVRAALWAACVHPERCKNCSEETVAYAAGARAYLGISEPEPEDFRNAKEAAVARLGQNRQRVPDEDKLLANIEFRRSLAMIELHKSDPNRGTSSQTGALEVDEFAKHLGKSLACMASRGDFDVRLIAAHREIEEFDRRRRKETQGEQGDARLSEVAPEYDPGPEVELKTPPDTIVPEKEQETRSKPVSESPEDPVPPNEPPVPPADDTPEEKKRFWTRRNTVAVSAAALVVLVACAVWACPRSSSEKPLIQVTSIEVGSSTFWIPADADFSTYPYGPPSEDVYDANLMEYYTSGYDWIYENGGEKIQNYGYEIKNVSNSSMQVSLQNIHLEGRRTTPNDPGFEVGMSSEGAVETIYASLDIDSGDAHAEVDYADGSAASGPTFYTLQPGEVVNIIVHLNSGKYDFEGSIILEATQGADTKREYTLPTPDGSDVIRLHGLGGRNLYVDLGVEGPVCTVLRSPDSYASTIGCTADEIQSTLRDLWADF